MIRLLLPLLLAAAPSLWAAPRPQTNLPSLSLCLGTNSLRVQVAADEPSRELGLMSRTNLSEQEGMLFVFPSPQPVSFWMKDTLLPLSVAYLGVSGRIFEIHDLRPRDETPVPSSSRAVAYALEVPQGWFGRHGLMAGDSVAGLPSPASAR
jgi:uncharacterized membrane protein (UPF0127 family)